MALKATKADVVLLNTFTVKTGETHGGGICVSQRDLGGRVSFIRPKKSYLKETADELLVFTWM